MIHDWSQNTDQIPGLLTSESQFVTISDQEWAQHSKEIVTNCQQMICRGCRTVYCLPLDPVTITMMCPTCGRIAINKDWE